MKSLFHPFVLFLACCFAWVGCGPSTPSITLHQAVEQGNLRAVQQHIAAKTDLNQVDAAGWTPLHLAAMKGDLTIVQALTAAGADVNRRGQGGKTALALAQEKRQMAVVKYLQDAGKGRRLVDGGLGVSEALDMQ